MSATGTPRRHTPLDTHRAAAQVRRRGTRFSPRALLFPSPAPPTRFRLPPHSRSRKFSGPLDLQTLLDAINASRACTEQRLDSALSRIEAQGNAINRTVDALTALQASHEQTDKRLSALQAHQEEAAARIEALELRIADSSGAPASPMPDKAMEDVLKRLEHLESRCPTPEPSVGTASGPTTPPLGGSFSARGPARDPHHYDKRVIRIFADVRVRAAWWSQISAASRNQPVCQVSRSISKAHCWQRCIRRSLAAPSTAQLSTPLASSRLFVAMTANTRRSR